MLPNYVSHSWVKMLSQTKLIVLPLQTKTNRHPNKNQCKIIWLSLFAKQKPFRDHFRWLFSVIIFRDYFFSSHPNNKPCKEMQRVMLFHYESKQYASISLQNYLTSLFDKQKPVHDYFLLSLQQLVYSKCVKIATFYFLTTNTLPHYFSTRCQIPPCHNIRIFQLHQNLQFTVYYCFLCWPLVHRHAICSTFYFFSGSILSYYTYSSYDWPLTDIDSNANWCNWNFYGFPCHLPNNNLSVICFL